MPKKILIAEDEAHIRLLIEQSLEELEDEGVDILTASNGEEALSQILSEQPELVFLDIMMPKLNGFEVCERISKDTPSTRVHVILLTAKGQEYDRVHGAQAGADGYMTKPFNPDELLSIARRILSMGES